MTGKNAARLLIVIGILHTALFAWFGRRIIASMAREGFWNTVDPLRDRQMILWALMTGVLGLLLGQLALWVEKLPRPLPAFIGWEIVAIALLGGVLMPYSAGWLLLLPGVMILIGANRSKRAEKSF